MDPHSTSAYSYEEALELVLLNHKFSIQDIKSLRFACKRSKERADDQITKLRVDLTVDPGLLTTSGLLPRLKELGVNLQGGLENAPETGYPWVDEEIPQKYARIIAQECSQTLRRLGVNGKFTRWPSEGMHTFGRILGESDFVNLEILELMHCERFLAAFLAGGDKHPQQLPSLKVLRGWESLSLEDLQMLMKYPHIFRNFDEIYAVDEITPEQGMLQLGGHSDILQAFTEAVNLKRLRWIFQNKLLTDMPFQSLEYLHLDYVDVEATLTPLLSRPWPRLQHLVLGQGDVEPDDLIALGDAVNMFPMLETLEFIDVSCDWITLRNSELPIKKLVVCNSVPSGDSADALSESLFSLRALRHFVFNAGPSGHLRSFDCIKPLVLGTHMFKFESFIIVDWQPQHAVKFVEALSENLQLPNMKSLELFFGLPSVRAMTSLLGYGALGGLPNLEEIVFANRDSDDSEELLRIMTEEDARQAFHRIWPNLVLKFVSY